MSAARSVEDMRLTFEATRMPRGPLLVASDGLEASNPIFPVARVLAAHTGAPVEVVSAVQPNTLPTFGFEAIPVPAMPTAELLDDRVRQMQAQMIRLGVDPTAWPVSVRVGEGAHELVAAARERDARLLVVGRGRHDLVERLFTGETVLRLLQLGDTPVLAVDPSLSRVPSRVIIGTDFSVFSIFAAEVALDYVAADAEVEFVHVGPAVGDAGDAMQTFVDEYRKQAEASFAALIKRVERPGLRFTTTLLEGHPANRLLAHVRERTPDVVVTSTHGYGFVRRMMLGSVAATLVRQAPCSVMCVPGSAHARAAARARAASRSERTRVLQDNEMAEALAAFSERHQRRACSVEVHQHDIGVQALGHHLPLEGISWEPDTRSVVLTFGTGQSIGAHLSHAIGGVRQVALMADAAGADQLLQLVYAAGETLVVLE